MARLHPTALIDAGAELHPSVEVGPYAVIGAGVRVGEGTRIGAHCVLEGPMTLGRDNVVHAHAALGCTPQDKKYAGEPTELHIGDGNTIFQFCTFSRGTVQDGGVTRVGDRNWIMAYVHIAHDVQLGHDTILANNATLAGHVHVGDWAIVGGLTGVHQFCKIGAHAITGFQSHVSQDVPPFMTVSGNPLAVHGVNLEGLRRRGFSRERIAQVRQMHRLLYRDGLTLEAAKAAIGALRGTVDGGDGDLALLLDFLEASTRGIVR
ncbi:acyl-ACP--UDP-N-acetylglucosamine O-acyltransferase [Rubrivivax albus]|uniref:Acyl-[acyl-carrier-protein]--UDP-N-acetylglucosamine O-acyltransferase n=1 Tax=Rubrivivax albus TaxID=2499835 RepID=A0A437K1E6_9BURK|nr:acyl-ACP--UDP-N-acetylglucosamine O-acyltransferase [Rubrivivax albus]RVT54198.1 acyl-ACP--UDP-N-acetylglucosamine O-acyltransferase [Rubrivivax albus]